MKVVQPIRDFEKVEEIMRLLKADNERNYVLFMVGVGTDTYNKMMVDFSWFYETFKGFSFCFVEWCDWGGLY